MKQLETIVTGKENLVNASNSIHQRFLGQPQEFSAQFPPELAEFQIRTVFGIDFSGAKSAGKNAWMAQMTVLDPNNRAPQQKITSPLFKLVDLRPLGRLAGGDERDVVYPFLTRSILDSDHALWGMDFPFGLPIELGLGDWPDQLRHVAEHPGDAKTYGRGLVERALGLGGNMHIRRDSDRETKTPFDCYHYRIIYQTFHGMKDVLSPIAGQSGTLVMPFESDRAKTISVNKNQTPIQRVVVESCPSSTLKRWSMPHQKYKQCGNRPLDEVRRRTRRVIMKKVSTLVEISPHRRRVMMNNLGGDAIDAVIAGVGAWQAWQREDHAAIAMHDRYPIEGRVYC